MKKPFVLLVINIENLKTLKYRIFWKRYKFFLLFKVIVAMKMKKYLKKKNRLRC